MKREIWLALLACLGAMAFWTCARFRGESHKGSLIFPHRKHVEQADCSDCHKGVERSSGSTCGAFIPRKHEGCATCHEEDVKSNCERCHRGARDGIQFPRIDRRLNFSHAAHGSRVKTCQACHPNEHRGSAFIPGHGTCNSSDCHRSEYKATRCAKCHQDLQRYQIKPGRGILAHGPGFDRAHGVQARQSVKTCAQCHDQTFCAECHAAKTSAAKPSIVFPEKVDARFIHRGDFLSRHFIEARADGGACLKCHGQYHCRACHALNGLAVSPDTNLRGRITRSAHPAGWTKPGDPQHHGRQARQDIARCASCHDRGAQSNCVSCHRVGGIGGSPHPRGWGWANKSMECRTAGSCASCHPGGQGCR
jgi:hypothetical protein